MSTRGSVLLVAAVAACASWPQRAMAASDGRAQRLLKALEAARRELAEDTQRLARETKAREAQVQRLGAEQARLSDEVVELKLAVAKLTREEAAAAPELDRRAQDAARQQKDAARLHRTMTDAVARVGGHLTSLVPCSRRSAQLQRVDELREGLKHDGAGLDPLKRFVAVLGELLAESRTSERYAATTRTARGTEASVAMLRVGHVASAYVAPGGQVALALRAPDGEGFRWNEALPGRVTRAIESAAGALGRDGAVPFPLDVTRSLSQQLRHGRRALWERLGAGGVVMIPLALVAALAAALIVERLALFAREARASEKDARAVLAHCERGELAEAERYCERGRGPVVRALGACLKYRRQGVAAMEDGVQEAILHELPRLERFLSTLSILATVAPLLGLLGTVTGMIHTFDMITVHGSGEPRLMAGGISEALVTTATGLVVAIPILLVHNVLSGKMERVVADTERFAASLLVRLQERGLVPDGGEADDGSGEAASEEAGDGRHPS